jgi:hypothetical protein
MYYSRPEPRCSRLEWRAGVVLPSFDAMKLPRLRRISRSFGIWALPLALMPPKAATAQPAAAEPPSSQPAKRPADLKTAVITTNLLSPWFGAYTLDASFRVANHWAVFVNSSYFSLENADWKARSGSLGAGLQYYFQGSALRRWYVEGFSELLLSSWRFEPSGNTADLVPGVSWGSVFGYRWVWQPGLVFDLAAGALWMHFPSAHVETDAGGVSSAAFTRLYPAVKLNLGWAF